MNGTQHNSTRSLVCFVGTIILVALWFPELGKTNAIPIGVLAVLMLTLSAAFGFLALVQRG